ncbi:MAG: DUF2141 domain-containing protein [Deltaproteobacteria bacterium]|nr:DUF2141 domain-containing protein [Deltaproteobacteria bacterium]
MRIGLFALALTLSAPDGGAPSATLRVKVHGLHNATGQVGCLVFATGDDFPTKPDKAVAKALVPITKSGVAFEAVCEFPQLAPGTYAVSVMHDENGNGKMDFNFLHMPKEGYGASRDHLPMMSPPSFDDCKLPVGAGLTEIDVHMKYP